jgi:hypothetical protein
MSNPNGTDDAAPEDRGGDSESADTGPTVLAPESEPLTEVIDLGGDAPTGQRRYTAPGFDAGSTQIIDRVPDSPTEFPGAAGGTRTAGPLTVPAHRSRRPRWLTALVAAGAVAAVALAAALVWFLTGPRVSDEDLVRSSIEAFDTAVQRGDLATLRGITCGQTRENYAAYDDESWTQTYAKVLAARQYPVVAEIGEVVVNGDRAEANVTSYMAFDPATVSTRSFDLQFTDEQWKICQAS